MKTVSLLNEKLKIQFRLPGDEFHACLTLVKSLPGRHYVDTGKYWSAPVLRESIQTLYKAGFEFDFDIEHFTSSENDWTNVEIPDLPELFPYQREGVQFLIWRQGRGLITDEMGLGKTVQALGYLKVFKIKRPVLIVCNASTKLQWRNEYRKWLHETDIEVLSGTRPRLLNPKKSYIINYDVLSTIKEKIVFNTETKARYVEKEEIGWANVLKTMPFEVIIADECQALSNPKAKRTIGFKKIAKRIPEFIGLSGTPIRSRPAQFYTVLNLVNPTLFSNRQEFYYRYCGSFNSGFRGCTNAAELHELVSKVMIRRQKKDVLKDLPDKIRSAIPLDISNYDEYNDELKKLQDCSEADLTARMEALKYSAFSIKKEAAIAWIKDFLESGEKLVIAAYHKAVLDYICTKFKCVRLDGSVPPAERPALIQKFQEDPDTKVFVGNIIAAGVGIDGLQKVCSNMVVLELIWTPTDHLQIEDRLHRIGQKGCVNVYYLIAPGTIEDDMIEILDRKMKMISSVMDGREADKDDLLKEMIKKYRGKNGNN